SSELNEDYVVDMAARFFNKIRLEKTADDIQTAIERNDIDEAQLAFSSYEPVAFGSNGFVHPFSKAQASKTMRYLLEGERSIVKFSGALDEFLSPFFEREGFISFAGPEKRGKSFWLTEVVWRAIRQRRRVMYYSFGDMSENQVQARLYCRATERALFAADIQYPLAIRKLKSKDEANRSNVQVRHETRHVKGLSMSSIKRAAYKLNAVTASRQPKLKLRCAGGYVVSASEIEREVQEFSKDGWPPDLVVIDYADLLKAESQTLKQDVRHQINASWVILRRISLDYKCLVVTATQAAASSYDAWTIRKKDFSEDKRKNAHVTGMLGINQTSDEKEKGVYRLNWVFLRNGKWSDSKVVWTAGDLNTARPCIISSW